jgi:hypothetical protein
MIRSKIEANKQEISIDFDVEYFVDVGLEKEGESISVLAITKIEDSPT